MQLLYVNYIMDNIISIAASIEIDEYVCTYLYIDGHFLKLYIFFCTIFHVIKSFDSPFTRIIITHVLQY